MYSILDFGDMTMDKRRTDAYALALSTQITPNSVVLDLGAGAGSMTLLACRAGARRVYAVEPDPVIELARELVSANGYSDRVEFIQGLSTSIDLPEKVDVIVADIRGVLPFFSGSLNSIIDARDRFLKPGGTIIPLRDTVWVAPVSDADYYKRLVEPWENDGYGFDGAAGRSRAVNLWTKWKASGSQLLAEPQVWTTLDYSRLTDANHKGTCTFSVSAVAEAHGLAAWFDCVTIEGSGFSNAPAYGKINLYQRAFFPLTQPLALQPGDELSVRMRVDSVGGDHVYGWDTEVWPGGDSEHPSSSFRQSTFRGNPLTSDWLRKTGSSFTPEPNKDASIDRLILEAFFGGSTLEQISQQLSERFPERFSDWRKALTRVAELSMRYSS